MGSFDLGKVALIFIKNPIKAPKIRIHLYLEITSALILPFILLQVISGHKLKASPNLYE
jgi:hypothetical protein